MTCHASLSARALIALVTLGTGACEPATDIAGHIRTDAGDGAGIMTPAAVPQVAAAPEPSSTEHRTSPAPPPSPKAPLQQAPHFGSQQEAQWNIPDAGAHRQGGSFFEEGLTDPREGEVTGRGPSGPFVDEGLLWVRGWQLTDWTGETHPWPLETGLDSFFQEPPGDRQAAVWVSGEDASKLSSWWQNIPLEDPAIRQLEGQRFVVAEDHVGLTYAVTAERPSDGTFSLLPLPKEGLDRD